MDIQNKKEEKINEDLINWQNFKKHLSENLSIIKIGLIIFTLYFIYSFWIQCNSQRLYFKQSGGFAPGKLITAPAKGVGKGLGGIGKGMQKGVKGAGVGIDKVKGGLSKIGGTSFISGGFSIVFQFVNAFLMLFGIIIVLIIIPTLPIIIFMGISYFICRRKLWKLRTM